MIARAQAQDAWANRFDDPGAFVAQHHGRQRCCPGAISSVQAAVAHAAGGHSDQHFAGPRLVELHILDHERFTHRMQNRGLHARQRTNTLALSGYNAMEV